MERIHYANGLAGSIVAEQIVAFVNDYRHGTRTCISTSTIDMPKAAKLPAYKYSIARRVKSYDMFLLPNTTQADSALYVWVKVECGGEDATSMALGDMLTTIREQTGETMHMVMHAGTGIMLEFPDL